MHPIPPTHLRIDHDGQQLGPLSLGNVRAGLTAGSIAPTDLAWHTGALEWQPLSAIPGVEGFSAFRQVSPKNDYDFGFSMDFADKAAYEAYNNHPVHVAFVKDRWQTAVSRFLEIDSQGI